MMKKSWKSAKKSWMTSSKILDLWSRPMLFCSNPKRKLWWLRMMKTNKISATHLILRRNIYLTDGKQSGPNIFQRVIAMPRFQCSTTWGNSSWRTNMSNKRESRKKRNIISTSSAVRHLFLSLFQWRSSDFLSTASSTSLTIWKWLPLKQKRLGTNWG